MDGIFYITSNYYMNCVSGYAYNGMYCWRKGEKLQYGALYYTDTGFQNVPTLL